MSKQTEMSFLQALSQFTLSRSALLRALNPTRDIDTACGYPTDIAVDDYKTMYDRNGVAERVVKLFPDECWSVVPEVYETENEEEETVFEKAWKYLVEERQVLDYLYRIDVASGVGQYGLLILGVNDGASSLAEPLKKSNGKATRELLYLKVVEQSVVDIKTKDTNVSSARYGKPEIYTVQFEALDGTTSGSEKKEVHWSRVLHVADGRLSSDVFGTPRMKPVYNYLLDLKKVGGGSGEMFWRGGFPGISFKINPDRTAALSTVEKEEMREEMTNYSNDLQRYFAVVGAEASSMTPQVADPSGHVDMQVKKIAMTMGVPYRVFIGTEEAKLASSQDMKTWYRRVRRRQVGYLTSRVLRPFVDAMVGAGVMPKPKEYFVDWPPLGESDEKENSEVMKNKTEAMAKYAAGGVADALMAPMEYLTLVLGYTADEAETILKGLEERVAELDLERQDELGEEDEDLLEEGEEAA